MAIPPGQEATAAFLRRLAGAAPIETHISVVFVGSDTVWKLKKAVKLPFLDFTSIEDRRRFTQRELALNAPAAPGLYRDVVAVVRQTDGTPALAETPADAPVIDWVLRMARVPEGDFLDAIAARGALTPALLDALADAVAAYHQALPPIAGVLPPMREIARGNVPSALSAGLPEADVAAWRDAILAALDSLQPLLRQRAQAGLVRRAHGDLHLGNLCLWQERPVPFDALEFDETLATIDLAYDFAFLLMDLDRRVDRAAANRVMNRYVARTGDVGLVATLPAFMSIRAMVRAHVEARSGHAAAWQPYLRAALEYFVLCPGWSWWRWVACPAAASPRWRALWYRSWAGRRARSSCAVTKSASASMAPRRNNGCRNPPIRMQRARRCSRPWRKACAPPPSAGSAWWRMPRSSTLPIARQWKRPHRRPARGSSASGWTRRWQNWNGGWLPAAATPPTPRSRCCERRSEPVLAPATGTHSRRAGRRTTWPWRGRCSADQRSRRRTVLAAERLAPSPCQRSTAIPLHATP